jgi:L-fuconate dehydratase
MAKKQVRRQQNWDRIALRLRGMHYVQADSTRLAGVSEFLTVSPLAKKLGLPIVPHLGDMGQIHQHLVPFNHIALNHELVFSSTYLTSRSTFVSQPR